MNADGSQAPGSQTAPRGTGSGSGEPLNPAEVLDDEPSVVSSWRDAPLLDSLSATEPRTETAEDALAAEIWLRHWLYAGECSSTIEEAIALGQSASRPGFSNAFCRRFEEMLKPLRKNDDGREMPGAEVLDERETRIWGLLVKRVRAFLDADGLMALIPDGIHNDDDGVAVPFRFESDGEGVCLDANRNVLAGGDWGEVLEKLGDIGPLTDGQALRVEAVFPSGTPPGGASIGLSVALAWARRLARELPLFSPLNVLATGKLAGDQVSAVDGTGGQTEADTQGGAKGQLARRLGVSLYVTADAATGFSAGNGMKICSLTSGTTWEAAKNRIVEAVKDMALSDSPRHLRRVAVEDPALISRGQESEAGLWACWRRLGRLLEHDGQHEQVSDLEKLEAWRRSAVLKLGYQSGIPGFCDFGAVEARHGEGELRGRRTELERMDSFLSENSGLLPVIGPVGHGKSALLTTWRRLLQARRTHSVFYHYFDQSDERLQSRLVFYRRLVEHLLLESEGRPPSRETTEQDVLEAWDRWRHKEHKPPLVLVIDGLDEAEQCPPPFPDKLPEGVWFVVSCRSGADSALHPAIAAWKKRAGCACCEPLEVVALDIPNLCSWLATLTEDWTPTTPVVQRLAEEVLSRTRGVPLFIHRLWEDLREAVARRQDVIEALRNTPTGLEEEWQQLRATAWSHKTAEVCLELIAYLAAAKGPLATHELATLLNLSPMMNLGQFPRETLRRWVEVRPSLDAWGDRFSLSSCLIREELGTRLQPAQYAKKLVDQCRNQWREGSPYALRHLADHLIEEGRWRELQELVTGTDACEFQRLQDESFVDEPALLLAAVRRSLEAEVQKEAPDIVALAELSLSQAALVHRHTKPLAGDEIDKLSPLQLAERMTRLPVQWDPAAGFMWHLVSAWQLNREGHSAERNNHLNALGAMRDVRLPTSWGLLAGVILTETVAPFNPLLRLFAERHVLSGEAVAEMVGRMARRGLSGRRAALQWLNSSEPDNQAELRRQVVWNLAFSGCWDDAGREALWAPTIKEQANLLLALAELGEDSPALAGAFRDWTEMLESRFSVSKAQLPDGDRKRTQSILGRVQAIRVRLRLLAGYNDVEALVRKSEDAVRGREFEYGSGQFDAQVALALAFAAAAAKRTDEEARTRLCVNARLHRRNAFRAWLRLRQKPNAHTLEIFQIWLWFTHLTSELVRYGALSNRIGQRWACRLRQTLLPAQRTDAVRIYRLLNTQTSGRRQTIAEDGGDSAAFSARYLEPVEWDHAIVAAVEAALASSFSDEEVLQVIRRSRGDKQRARALARWVHYLVESGRANDAGAALADAHLSGDDEAAAYSLLARRLMTAGDSDAAARHATASIQKGTDRLPGWWSGQRAELLTALACAAGREGDALYNEAVELVKERRYSLPLEKAFRYLNLAEAAYKIRGYEEANSWFDKLLDLVKPDHLGPAPRELTVPILCEYAQRLDALGLNQKDKGRALSRARGAARTEPSLQRRCEMLCDVAEAYAACGDILTANELFADMQAEIPPSPDLLKRFPNQFLWRKRGIKPRLLRGHCLGELILGLGKAAMRQPHLQHQRRPSWREPWLQWTRSTSLRRPQVERMRPVYGAVHQGDFRAAFREAGRLAGSNSLALRQAVFREIARCTHWAGWALMYTDDRDAQMQDSALRGWALASAVKGRWNDAWRFLGRIRDPSIGANAVRDLAEYSARHGGVYDVRQRAKNLMASQDKDRVLHRVATALAARLRHSSGREEKVNIKRAVFELVPHCGEFFGAAYVMLARVVEMEPRRWREVAEVLAARELIRRGASDHGQARSSVRRGRVWE